MHIHSAISNNAQTYQVKALPSGNKLPPTHSQDLANISESAHVQLQQGNKINHKSSSQLTLLTGNDLVMEFGMLALGGEKQLANWKEQGLEISEQTIQDAFQAFQDGTQKIMNKNNSHQQGLVINRHEIVKNSQQVPQWFEQEYQDKLSNIEDKETKQAFGQGAHYHLSLHNTSVNKALTAYQNS